MSCKALVSACFPSAFSVSRRVWRPGNREGLRDVRSVLMRMMVVMDSDDNDGWWRWCFEGLGLALVLSGVPQDVLGNEGVGGARSVLVRMMVMMDSDDNDGWCWWWWWTMMMMTMMDDDDDGRWWEWCTSFKHDVKQLTCFLSTAGAADKRRRGDRFSFNQRRGDRFNFNQGYVHCLECITLQLLDHRV